MIRTIEVLFVIIILAGAFIGASYFAVLPAPRQVSPINLNRLSLTTLQMLDSDYDLSRAAFETDNSTVLGQLQVALSASLPPNVIYNLTVYDVNDGGGQLYTSVANFSNAESLGTTSDVSMYTVASSNVTFNVTPEKIGEKSNGGTLYILNCSDANGWWITGYTAQSLAQDLYNLLSPYFVNTVMVQNTSQLAQILIGTPLHGENLQNAVVINTCGEAVPIPTTYCQALYSTDSYAYYSYFLGQRVNLYNWTWASIVGYPFYYVSNTVAFASGQNTWGIYGMQSTGQGGSRAFLEGVNNQSYVSNSNAITDSANRVVTFTQAAIDSCNYYGIYPSIYQTSTRALSNSTMSSYNLKVGFNVFNPSGDYLAGAVYNHVATGSTNITGSLLALGLTRTPDVRVTALSLLSYYQPRLYPSEYTASGTSRLVVLQLGLAGGS
ncbi:MAG: hypothetical protein ABSB10_09925 [Candidatus Bathyarchaeia archaeon]|jgi:hypothetical protein